MDAAAGEATAMYKGNGLRSGSRRDSRGGGGYRRVGGIGERSRWGSGQRDRHAMEREGSRALRC